MSTMSPSIVVDLTENEDLSVSALEELKNWLVCYVYTTPGSIHKYYGTRYIEAKTIADVMPIAVAMCESHMNKVVCEYPDDHIKVHEWDGYQITSISLCTPGSL